MSTEENTDISDGLRKFLYFTAAVTGAGILIVEILGAKMLSPFLGTSHFVWTAQIAVTLVALSAGYYAGGWLVDQSPKLGRLYYAVLGAAVYLAATVPMVKPISLKLMKLPLAWATLLASGFLFLIPLALLAMTGPFLVRLLTESVRSVGLSVGRLSAISTLGSVCGTLLIGYVLIPRLPNSVTMLITAGILIALSAVYFIVWGKGQGKNAMLLALGLTVIMGYSGIRGQFGKTMNYGGVKWEVLYRANSNYGELRVIEYRNGSVAERRYLNDQLVQNTYDPIIKKSRSLFTGALRWLAHAYTPETKKVLCIGMGVGVVPMQFAGDGIQTDVVEINGAVVPMAEDFFDFDSSRVNLTIGDGRQFLNQTEESYDAIILDAFLGDSSPSHLMTYEAFKKMKDHLAEQGVLVINSFGESNPERQFFSASLDKTLRAVFDDNKVVVHASGYGNVFFVATKDKQMKVHRSPEPDAESGRRLREAQSEQKAFVEWNKWHEMASGEGPFFSEHREVQQEMALMWKGRRTFNPDKGKLLSDDFNPVEFYDARNREENRRGLINLLHSSNE
jgi:spermidine synthase